MKAFLDTSVLLPAFCSWHVHHLPSLVLLEKIQPQEACCGAHSLAEVYSSLTRMPPPRRLRGDQARLILNDIRTKLSLISLTGDEYYRAINDYADQGIVGGTIYDGLLVRCAMKAKAEIIYTWNTRHFAFGPEVEKRLRIP